MSESISTAARERLEALVGEWTLEAGPPGGPPWPGGGRVIFEWLDGVPLLVARSHVELPEAPDGVAVIGCDGMSDCYYQLYTDERDVQRVYEMSLGDGVWKLWRYGEPFSQRFTGIGHRADARRKPSGSRTQGARRATARERPRTPSRAGLQPRESRPPRAPGRARGGANRPG